MRKSKKETIIMNIGTSSMIVILIGLSFAVLAALAISSARNDYRLSRELAAHNKEYYDASNRAWETLAESDIIHYMRDDNDTASFEIPVNDYQELQVGICFRDETDEFDIVKWKVVNTGDWEGDTSIPVMQTP